MKSIDELYEENANFIYYIANKHFKNYKNKEDLYQAGILGFTEAYNNYNPSMNIKFTSYAYKSIFGEMSKLIREDKPIKISRQISSLNYKIEKVYILLSQKLMRNPSISEVASYLEIPEDLVVDSLNSIMSVQSIEEPLANDGKEFTYEDIIGYSDNVEDKMILNDALDSLNSYDRNIIENRYFNDYTQSELASMLNTNQVQISRKEKQILKKMHKKIVA